MAVREASCVLGDYLQKMKGMCVGNLMGEGSTVDGLHVVAVVC